MQIKFSNVPTRMAFRTNGDISELIFHYARSYFNLVSIVHVNFLRTMKYKKNGVKVKRHKHVYGAITHIGRTKLMI